MLGVYSRPVFSFSVLLKTLVTEQMNCTLHVIRRGGTCPLLSVARGELARAVQESSPWCHPGEDGGQQVTNLCCNDF